MSNVLALHAGIAAPTTEPNTTLVAAIEQLLDLAKTGQLQSYIGTGFTCDGLRVSTWCNFHDNKYEMLGSLEWIKAEYIDRTTEKFLVETT